jgi:acyl-CoA thioesterase
MDTQEEKDQLAKEVVAEMLDKDAFSKWLGIEVLEIKEGYSKLQLTIRDEMVNGFDIVHGGIAYSLADTAFAFACNNRNNVSVALDAFVTYAKAVMPGDVLTAEAKELHNGRRTGHYHIVIINQKNQEIAFFSGTCYRTGKVLIRK